MFGIIKTRLKQKFRTMPWPNGPVPELPERFAGCPRIIGPCRQGCRTCIEICPTRAVSLTRGHGQAVAIDLGKCIFCRKCETLCPENVICFTSQHRLSALNRQHLVVSRDQNRLPEISVDPRNRMFSRSLKLRQVCAGGCNACEADTNVLGTVGWDLARFGIDFVASPRHADGLLITGPVTGTMEKALIKTYEAVPDPKVVIAVGACAISGGLYMGHPEQKDGAGTVVPVDLFIPGCPPHPFVILESLLRFLGRI
ncbi:MAG: 4Fe-4S dicluster domain-containing protein [Pseudomonadota bacterium]